MVIFVSVLTVMNIKQISFGVLLSLATAGAVLADFQNPVIAKDWPDPTVWYAGGKFYSVATGLRTLMTSSDLISWTDTGDSPISPDARGKLEAISRNIWAPCVTRIGNNWVLYISLFISDDDCKIAALTSTRPTGPFEFRGVVIDTRREGILNAIDPFVLTVDGKAMMFFGSLADGVHVVDLASDGLSIASGAKPLHVAGIRKPESKMVGAYEGSYVMHRNGWWYLFVSGGHYANHTYYLTVGRSKSVKGPYSDREGNNLTAGKAKPILSSSADDWFYGPGHNGDVFTTQDGRTMIFYHSHCKGYDPKERPTLLQEMKWDADGWPYFVNGKPAKAEREFKVRVQEPVK